MGSTWFTGGVVAAPRGRIQFDFTFNGIRYRPLKVRYRRPYTARQTSVSWNLMAGKNPLWVAKQHGHSIATMLRAYAACAEGTAEVDIGAIKRSMNASEAPPVINLAVDLSVAEALQARRASTSDPYALRRHALTNCSIKGI